MRKIYVLLLFLLFTKVSGQNIFPSTGSVGIGTTSPVTPFQVVIPYSNTAGTASFRIVNGSKNPALWILNEESTGITALDFTGTTGYQGRIRVGGVETMSFLNNGNVGIGTSNPTQKLEIGGGRPITFNSSLGIIKMKGDPGGWAMNYGFSGSNGTDLGGFWGYGGADNLVQWSIGKLYTDNFFVVKSTGNVGIGTVNPTNKLDVQAPNAANFGTTIPCCVSNYTLAISEATSSNSRLPSIQFHSAGYQEGFLRLASDSRVFEIGDNQSVGVDFAIRNSTNTTRNVLLSGRGNSYFNVGNFGIGTSSPAQKLSITTLTDFDGLTILNSTQSPMIRLNSGHVNTSARNWGITTNHFQFGDFNILGSSAAGGGVTSAWLTISKDGNVGLTNTNPQAKLDVSGTSRLGAGIAESWFPYSDNYAYVSGKGIIFRKDTPGNAIEMMRIAENGNVGIDNSSPIAKLDVKGITTFGIRYLRTDAQDARISIGDNSGKIWSWATGWAMGTAGDFSLIEEGVSGNRLYIQKVTGNVGIGTSTPKTTLDVNGNVGIGLGVNVFPADYKLAVAGNVIAEKVKVKKQSSGWPDFVFAPTYKLPNLSEVETFVKQNSHLPEIPSAAEIEKDGQDLGEMNRLLLKKVEELTLYLIEIEKKNKEQDLLIQKLLKR